MTKICIIAFPILLNFLSLCKLNTGFPYFVIIRKAAQAAVPGGEFQVDPVPPPSGTAALRRPRGTAQGANLSTGFVLVFR